ncbi:hypothetical protein GCM10022278_04060 [Allohahella marinimesophila]|uniref:Uncharacterized protein n=1 Tax=Allohahella marinimesophila TaxID=1054972 RepID=A0ABP7NIS1_9GAMM
MSIHSVQSRDRSELVRAAMDRWCELQMKTMDSPDVRMVNKDRTVILDDNDYHFQQLID